MHSVPTAVHITIKQTASKHTVNKCRKYLIHLKLSPRSVVKLPVATCSNKWTTHIYTFPIIFNTQLRQKPNQWQNQPNDAGKQQQKKLSATFSCNEPWHWLYGENWWRGNNVDVDWERRRNELVLQLPENTVNCFVDVRDNRNAVSVGDIGEVGAGTIVVIDRRPSRLHRHDTHRVNDSVLSTANVPRQRG